MVVPHNLEMLVVWGAGHNVQCVSQHGFEMYLAKYISKSEPMTKIELPDISTREVPKNQRDWSYWGN